MFFVAENFAGFITFRTFAIGLAMNQAVHID
jgi:hypothetical protein